MARKKYYHINLPPDVQAFKDRMLKAVEWDKTTCFLTFYHMYGKYFVRSQSKLTGQRVKRSKTFARTMHNARLLAQASTIAKNIYKALTEDWRCHDLYRKLVGVGVKLLHAGASEEETKKGIHEELYRLGYRTEWPVWQLPPNLQEWVEEEKCSKPAPALIVNEHGRLIGLSVTIRNIDCLHSTIADCPARIVLEASAQGRGP